MPKSEKVNTAEMNLSDDQEDVVSPPGMIMRSGRKKRRRSKDTTGLTPEYLAKKKRTKASLGTDNEEFSDEELKPHENDKETEDDESMDDQGDEEFNVDDENVKDSTMEEKSVDDEPLPWLPTDVAVASVDALSDAACVDALLVDMKSKNAPITNLRLPSEKTPAKRTYDAKPADTPYDQRYLGRISLDDIQQVQEPPVVTRLADPVDQFQDISEPNEPRVETPVRRLLRTIQLTIKDIIVPSAADLDVDDEEVADHSSFIFRPHFWFVFIVVLQGLYFQYYLNPVLTSMYEFSGSSVLWYKNLVRVKPTIIENITEVEVIVPVPSPAKKISKVVEKIVGDEIVDNKDVIKLCDGLLVAKTELVEKTRGMEAVKEEIKRELDQVMLSLAEKEASLKAWDVALSKAEQEINQLLSVPPSEIPEVAEERDFVQALESLEEAALMKLDAKVVTAKVPMWHTAKSPECPQIPFDNNDPFISEPEIMDGSKHLKQAAYDAVQETMKKPEVEMSLKTWTQEELQSVDLNVTSPDSEELPADVDLLIGMTEEDAENVIKERLEASVHDTVGLLDVVARYNGAEVIRKGPRASTPSLVQTLPFLNRLMAATKLRFYGHGHYAALSPTIPPDALGQCWSFENVAKNRNPRWRDAYKRDAANGKYASLSIKLAKSTTIKRVVLEHNTSPNKSESSAIKDFRVLGYEDAKAGGNPIHLGSFRYEKDGPSSQQFQISEAHDVLQSITVAFDSAYNPDFACLYRVRVLED